MYSRCHKTSGNNRRSARGLTFRYRTQELPISRLEGDGAGQGLLVESFLVDPTAYPYYGQIDALDPPDVPLADLLSGPQDVVVGKSLADRHQVAVGDRLQIGIGETALVASVRGIVPSASAAPGGNLAPLLVGFVYLDYESAREAFDLAPVASEVFFTKWDAAAPFVLAAQVAGIAPEAETRTAADLLAQNEQVVSIVRPLILVVASLKVGSFILAESALSFLDLGVRPPAAAWGFMISAGREYLKTAPWISFFPGLTLALTVIACNLLGDAARDYLDPRLKM